MKRVLMVAKGISHPPIDARLILSDLIKQDDEFTLDHIPTPEHFPEQLEHFDALVLYYHLEEISEQALTAFDHYVSGGGGVLALHSATASFQSSPQYFKILGGRFLEHHVVSRFVVNPVKETILFPDISAFSIKDELYIHETEPEIQVHFTTRLKKNEIPIVWSHHYGQGRIFYASPGHRTQTMRHPQYQALILNGLRWICM